MQRSDGKRYESTAARWLSQRGLRILDRNFRTRYGELDIIALDQGCVVFVEVRSRSHARFGGAAASVDHRKQKRLLRTAEAFLQRHPQWANHPCRFDVVAYELQQADTAPRWIRGAFSASPW